MNWPKHDAAKEFYMDIGTHLIEKNGLFLDRYKVWEEWDRNSVGFATANLMLVTFPTYFLLSF